MKKISLLICLLPSCLFPNQRKEVSPNYAILINQRQYCDVGNGNILKNQQVVMHSGKIKKIVEIDRKGRCTFTIITGKDQIF